MEPPQYYLPSPYSKGLGISTPERDRSLSGNFQRFSFASIADQKPTRFSLDGPSILQASSEKVVSQMQTTSKKMLDKMQDIDRSIADNKLPFLKYYVPGTETFKSKKEISHEIQTSFDFFKTDSSLFKGSKYKPKDFLFSSPRVKKTWMPKQITPMSEYKFETPVVSEKQEVQPNVQAQTSPSHLSPLHMRKAHLYKKMTFQDDDEEKVSPNMSSAHYTSLDTAPSIYQMQPIAEKVQTETEEMILVKYNKTKIPLNLYEGTLKRKNLMKDMRGSNNARQLEKQASQVVKKDDLKQAPLTASAMYREVKRKSSEEKEKRFGKTDMTTRSPVSNVYYQVLGMSSPRKKLLASKLKITLPNQSEKQGLNEIKSVKSAKGAL